MTNEYLGFYLKFYQFGPLEAILDTVLCILSFLFW